MSDLNLKRSFSAAVSESALTFAYGGWKWSPTSQEPPIASVLTAKLYTDEAFASVRHQLLQRRYRVQPVEGSSDEVFTLHIQGHGPGEADNKLRVYCPSRIAGVPSNVVDLDFSLVVHHAQPLREPPHHVPAALAKGAMTVIWGSPNDVTYCYTKMASVGAPIRTVDMQYYIKGNLGAMDHTAQCQLIRVMGDPRHFRAKVCSHLCGLQVMGYLK